jgi:outer membrane protein assembly factor BamB
MALAPDGTVQWEFATGRNIVSSPAIAGDGTLYVGSDNLYALGQ